MYKQSILSLFLLFQGSAYLNAQANAYILKTGTTLGLQDWGGGSRSPLMRYHGAFQYESISSNNRNVVYAQLGYHVKGGGIRVFQFRDINNNLYKGGFFGNEFHNIALDIGMKQFLNEKKFRPFYAVGLRGEFTAKTKFELYGELKEWVRKFNYGISARVGAEYPIKKLINIGIELNVAPDLSKQVFVPAYIRRLDPWTGQPVPGYEQKIVNFSMELSIYIKFIQQIIYIE
jgi:hypothetical protein